ncbi:MAG: putative lipopolysaccharide heptosyltransferase III [Pseudomonadota bacterium]
MSAFPIPCGELSRALVVKLRHHGDVLLTTPVFSVLKRAAPGCEIDALVYEETAPMLTGHPAIEQVYTIDRKLGRQGVSARIGAELRLYSALRARRYDLLIHLTESWRGAWLTKLLAPRYSVAIFSPLRPPARLWASAFTHLAPIPPLGNRHTVECHLDALRRLGIRPLPADKVLQFHPGTVATDRIAALLAPHALPAKDWIHMHPTSRWMFKTWTVAGYAELIDRLEERGQRVVLTAGPEPREMEFMADIVSRCGSTPINLAGQLTLKELGALIAMARLSVTIDSVPMHLAAAVGTPVVALFGPSSENEWGPWQVPHRVLVSGHACRPCRLDGCGGGKFAECLGALSPAQVLEAVDILLAQS